MIWSTSPPQLARHDSQFRSAKGMVQHTEKIHDSLVKADADVEPLRFFVIPPHAHTIGKLVVPFVAIDQRGFLREDLPHIFGVTSRPEALKDAKSDVTERRSQETHVFAEHLALRRGLFTPFGRASSEVFASQLIPDSYAEGYIADRITHLQALEKEAAEYDLLSDNRQGILIDELSLAITSLQAKLA